jgi:hypothetical protein
MLRLEAELRRVEVVHSGPELVAVYAQLRAECEAAGHALAQKAHTADRWIAATAIRLAIPLVSNDGIFRDAPGLQLETLPAGSMSRIPDSACTRLVPAAASAEQAERSRANEKVQLCRTFRQWS